MKHCPNARVLGVGDPCQSIYLFTGALPNSLDHLARSLRDSRPGQVVKIAKFDLPVCRRCPTSHVQAAQRVFGNRIQPCPGNPAGVIHEVSAGTTDLGQYEVDLKPGDLVLARKNIALMKLAYKQVKDGSTKSIHIVGETAFDEMLGNLTADTQKLKEKTSLKEIIEEINRETGRKKGPRADAIGKAINLNQRHRLGIIHEYYDAVEWIITQVNGNATQFPWEEMDRTIQLLTANRQLNSDNHADIIRFSSVHRAKGTEAGSVYILDPTTFLPDRFGSRSRRLRRDERVQEVNALYVALTRSKDRLTIVHPVEGELANNDKFIASLSQVKMAKYVEDADNSDAEG